MILKMFSVYDSKAEAYTPPFYEKTMGLAVRAFQETCNLADHPFNKYPEDYTLFSVGDFDDQNAKIELYATPVPVGKAIEFITADIHPLLQEVS